MKNIKPSEDFVKELRVSEPTVTGDVQNPQVISRQQSPASQSATSQTYQNSTSAVAGQEIINDDPQFMSVPATALDTSTPLVGSQIAQEKIKLPIGLWLIIGWTLIGIVTGLFDQSQTSLIYTIGMVIALCVGVALIFRLEGARKAMLWVCKILIVLSVIVIILTFMLHNLIDSKQALYSHAISQINRQTLTDTQKQQLTDQKMEIDALYRTAGRLFVIVYIKQTVNIVIAGFVIYYLSLPRIKKVFYPLPS